MIQIVVETRGMGFWKLSQVSLWIICMWGHLSYLGSWVVIKKVGLHYFSLINCG